MGPGSHVVNDHFPCRKRAILKLREDYQAKWAAGFNLRVFHELMSKRHCADSRSPNADVPGDSGAVIR